MKKNLVLLSALVLLVVMNVNAQVFNFSFTGTTQTWTVPAGASSIEIDIKGGSGGTSSYYSPGGCGGRVVCTLAVTPGQVFYINVGEQGGDGAYYSAGPGGRTGGLTGLTGGNGGNGFFGSGGGGGGACTDIRLGSGTLLSARVAVAAGGGGGGADCGSDNGGDGGGTTGSDGEDCGSVYLGTCGAGGTPTAGGAGSGGGGLSGGSVFGGDGTGFFAAGGGGGGGYWGGGGGDAGGGGGGSSFATATATGVTHSAGSNCFANGSAQITILCSPPTGGAIVGPSNLCMGSTITYTNPSGTAGGTWSSSATGVFTVNPATGDVTAVSLGSGTLTYSITLSCGSASATYPITVVASPPPITGPLSICDLGYDTLFNTMPGGVWSSSVPGVANIDALSGFYNAVSPGTTTISYTVGACASTAVLTVNPYPPAIVGPTMVCQGSTITLTNSVPGGTWTSNVPTGVSIDPSTGVATGLIAGSSANIFYTPPSGCAVTHFVSVNISPAPITGPDQTCQGTAIALSETVAGGSWSSGSPAIASVSGAGVVSGLSGGVALISYTKSGCPPVTYPVTINPGPAAITGSTSICTGITTTLSSATPGGTWTSSNPSIVVTSTTGMVTSSAIGSSGTIYYTLPTGCYTSIVVNVNLGAPAMSGPLSICKGADSVFTNADPTGIWSSTDLAIAQIIDTSGVVTGISAGTVNISYTLPNGCFAVQTLVVDPLVAGVVNINRYPSGIICEDDTVWMVATPVVGGGTMPAFTWKKFSVTLPGATDDTLVYVAHTATSGLHGDVFNVFMFPNDGCPMYDSVADSIFMDVAPKDVHPAITIATTGPTVVSFAGQTVTFSSVVTWGGPSPTYQWFKNNVAIPGANGPTYSTTIYGTATYRCEVIGNPPCMDNVMPLGLGVSNDITIIDVLEVGNLTAGNDALSLFPNPNTGTFTLSGKLGSVSDNDVRYEVTNMLGQVVYTGNTTPKNGEINAVIKMDNIPSGTYMLQVRTDAGTETFHFVVGK